MSAVDSIVRVQVRRLPEAQDLPVPQRASRGAAGVDLRACVDADLVLEPGCRAKVPTGIAMALPHGYEGQVRPRSGLAAKHGIALVNSPGTIDADYRGEVAILMINHGTDAVTIQRGDRIAQLVVQRVPDVEFVEVDELTDTERGTGGFGHTGDR